MRIFTPTELRPAPDKLRTLADSMDSVDEAWATQQGYPTTAELGRWAEIIECLPGIMGLAFIAGFSAAMLVLIPFVR